MYLLPGVVFVTDILDFIFSQKKKNKICLSYGKLFNILWPKINLLGSTSFSDPNVFISKYFLTKHFFDKHFSSKNILFGPKNVFRSWVKILPKLKTLDLSLVFINLIDSIIIWSHMRSVLRIVKYWESAKSMMVKVSCSNPFLINIDILTFI